MTRPPAYLPLAGHYDEMVGPDGALRSHWQAVTSALAAAGRHELNRRTQEARRLIKPAYPSGRRERTFGRRLPEGQRARLADRIARQPHRYVAQEQVALSTAPVRVAGGLSPRFQVIRVYALSRGDGYDVLPGGLGRVSSWTGSLDVTLLGGGSSKDVWVVGETAESHRSLIPGSVSPV